MPVCLGFYVAILCAFISSFHTYALHGRLLSFVYVTLFTFITAVSSKLFYMFGSETNLYLDVRNVVEVVSTRSHPGEKLFECNVYNVYRKRFSTTFQSIMLIAAINENRIMA